MTAVQDAVVFLGKIGMWDVVLPFIFVFTIVYAALEKTKVLGVEAGGEPKHRFNAVVAFVVAFFILIAVDAMNIINRFSQYIVIALLLFVCTAIIVSFFGFRDAHVTYKKYFLPIAFIIFGIVVLYVFGWLEYFDLNALRKYEGVIVGLIVFFVIMWFILREGKKKEPKKEAEEEKKPAPAPKKQEPAPRQQIDLSKLAEVLPPKAAEELMEKAEAMGAEGPIVFEDLLESLSDESKTEIMKHAASLARQTRK